MKGLPNTWVSQGLSSVCLEIIDCVNKTAPTVDMPTPYRMIRTTNVKEGRVNLEGARYVDENTFRKWTRRTALKVNDIILTREAPLGEVGLVRSSEKLFLGQRTMVYRPNPKLLDQIYLYYSFISYTIQAQIRSLGSGSTVEHLRVPHAETLKILLPPLPIQRKIAAVLSAYDDLIENNTRRIAILEKMAEELYREWFVRLRFPGHVKTKIVKGVPEGWEVNNALSILNVLGGGTPKTENPSYWDGEISFFTPKDADDNYFTNKTEKTITPLGLEACSTKLFDKNTIFITARGTVGKIVLAMVPMAMNQSCYALQPKSKKHSFYYFLALRNAVHIIKATSNSGVFDNINTDSFKTFDLFCPTQKMLNDFEERVQPLFLQIEGLSKKQDILVVSRGRLLSRLMSGKIDLEHLDIHFPTSMREDVGRAHG